MAGLCDVPGLGSPSMDTALAEKHSLTQTVQSPVWITIWFGEIGRAVKGMLGAHQWQAQAVFDTVCQPWEENPSAGVK